MFKPYSQKEINDMNLWPEGNYHFEVLEAKQDTSKTGNPMLVVKNKLTNTDGKFRILTDYLVDTAQMAYKNRHFADALRLLDKYEAGTITPEDVVGRSGVCKVKVSPPSGQYEAQNRIVDYVIGDAEITIPAPKETEIPWSES